MTETKKRKLKVFLCHSKHDKVVVRELYERLKEEGWIEPWFDEENLLPGYDWGLEIEKAVENTDVVLVFLSSNSVDKEGYVQRELRFILNMADYKPEGTVFIIPLRLDDCPLSRRLRTWHYVDYFPENRKNWAYGRFLRSLRLRAEKMDIGIEALLAEKEEKRKIELVEKTRKEKEEKAREEKAEKKIVEKVEQERIAKEKRIADKKVRLEKETEGERKKKAAAEEVRQDRLAREKEEREEKARQNLLKKTQQKERLEGFRKFFQSKGVFIGIGIILFVCLVFGGGSILKNISASPTSTRIPPTDTKTPTPIIAPATETIAPTPEKILPTSTFVPVIGSTIVSEKDGMVQVYVPAGEFQMGSEQYDDEKPIHTVYLDEYWIDETEVTNEMYAKCVLAGDCDSPSESKSYARDSYYGNAEFNDYPVMYVSWEDANKYCTWAERRLPTEAEWEKAARGGLEGKKYPWGDIAPICEYGAENGAKFDDGAGCNDTDTEKVASYAPNGYGVYDMSGNLWEWVSDWHARSYYANSPLSNPLGPDTGEYRVLRGGSWYHDGSSLRSASRLRSYPSDSFNDVGFRCSRSRP